EIGHNPSSYSGPRRPEKEDGCSINEPVQGFESQNRWGYNPVEGDRVERNGGERVCSRNDGDDQHRGNTRLGDLPESVATNWHWVVIGEDPCGQPEGGERQHDQRDQPAATMCGGHES